MTKVEQVDRVYELFAQIPLPIFERYNVTMFIPVEHDQSPAIQVKTEKDRVLLFFGDSKVGISNKHDDKVWDTVYETAVTMHEQLGIMLRELGKLP